MTDYFRRPLLIMVHLTEAGYYSVDLVLHLILLAFSLGLSYYGFRLLKIFRGGLLESPFKVLVPSTLIFVVAESFNILLDIWGIPERALLASHIINNILEIFLVGFIFLSFFLFFKAWAKMARKQS